ncbi:hypothetical protein DM02DRAFT_663478 [Periconia macrospinosa]|uniref:Uncharacterized protein n=1 Tax=Periconia macrospinosa TaxID=97972 RepID=A0A2V1D1L3_9PLEO|nr:hypothetical protein DM02DRAFT_663478 [Periconia macrospinosa]
MAPIDYSKWDVALMPPYWLATWDNIDTDSEPETSPQQAPAPKANPPSDPDAQQSAASASAATHSASGSIQAVIVRCIDYNPDSDTGNDAMARMPPVPVGSRVSGIVQQRKHNRGPFVISGMALRWLSDLVWLAKIRALRGPSVKRRWKEEPFGTFVPPGTILT